MKMNKLVLFIGMAFFSSAATGQEYINSINLVKQMESRANAALFDATNLENMFKNFHLVQEKKKVKIKVLPPSNKALSAEEVFEQRYPSVFMFVQIYKDKEGKRKINGAGTAFPISEDGYFVINNHMVDELGLGVGDPAKVDKQVKLMMANHAGELFHIDSVVTFAKEADIAILKVNLNGQKIKPFALGNDPKTGAEVHVLSHPRSLHYYFSSGKVARLTEFGDRGIFSRKMEITADFAAGSSGGPIIDNKGNIAGLVSLTKSFYYDQANQKNLQMVIKETIPVSVIKALISE